MAAETLKCAEKIISLIEASKEQKIFTRHAETPKHRKKTSGARTKGPPFKFANSAIVVLVSLIGSRVASPGPGCCGDCSQGPLALLLAGTNQHPDARLLYNQFADSR